MAIRFLVRKSDSLPVLRYSFCSFLQIEEVANEGEAQRYFDHAVVLKKTIQFIRNNTDITIDTENQAPGLGEASMLS